LEKRKKSGTNPTIPARGSKDKRERKREEKQSQIILCPPLSLQGEGTPGSVLQIFFVEWVILQEFIFLWGDLDLGENNFDTKLPCVAFPSVQKK
jgi:hypothetical protein